MTVRLDPARIKTSAHPPGPIALAPMDGITDHAYRELWTSIHSPGRVAFCVSEFVRVSEQPLPDYVICRAYPEVEAGGLTRTGVPVLLQLLGGQPAPIAETARTATNLGAYGIDLNFGCPAKLVNRHDGGASLLRAPERIERIVDAVRRIVPGDRPVSAKIRLGWESSDEVVEIARAAERGGASWLTIHGRTKVAMYGPPADWEAIGRARAAVNIPVVANGDLNTLRALESCRAISGCTHFMLGRGPMARPSLLRSGIAQSEDTELRPLRDVLLEYLEILAREGNSEERQVARVKQWLSLAKRVDPALSAYFESIKTVLPRAELRRRLIS
ncbi:MAG TPA: tRNA-dihydrouridine synthase family protein [Polyangiaceae bacterium]